MACLLLYLAPLLLLLVMTVNCGQAMATPTPVVPDDANTPATMVTEDITCMTEWLLIANSSRARALTIPNTPAAIQAMLDEKVVKHQDQFFLSLILGYAPQLAADLKHCIRRRPSCPTTDLTRHLPCSVAGECVFNATLQSAVCVCQAGMTGMKCDVDIDECSRPDLNNCDQPPVAYCINSYGSFGCECNTGFDGNGRECEDVDECTAGVHQCNEHAMCNNTVGSYSCYCQSGYKGDGTNCQVDLCGSSANSELCYQIEAVKTDNKHVEEKLEERDLQINKLLSDMKVLTTIFVQQKTKVDQMEIQTKEHFRDIQQHSAKQFESINATLLEEGQRTKQHLRNMQLHSAPQFAAINATLTEEGQKTKQHFKSIKQHSVEQLSTISATLQEERKKCGIVSWKTFTMDTSSSVRNPFSGVVFNKTRPDTVIRVVYTTSIGFQHGGNNWHCVKVSVRINGRDCSDPAPIRSGSSGSTAHFQIHAGVVSGICNINTSGPLSFSTHIEAQCGTSDYRLGYHPGTGTLTSTLHIEELCNNQQN
ncbi:adhesion G protein-coupled receptor L4-like [Sycon ciliatum]|uniref:adhesion G protein-coupled receptor L4-like n=1 Tax=Sycon ciliatum TaxID=27933 RepID=UPI0031F64900